MIIVCPACGRRYRVDRSRLAAGVKLRCSGCRQVFDSRPPGRRPEPRSAAPAPPQPTGPASAPDGRPLVLIGDDDRPFRARAEKLLNSLGCRVETSAQGEAVFRAAVQRRPSLLLLSTHLPGLSGIAVCEGVKGSPHLRSIKVVLVGSSVTPPAVAETVRPGFEPDDRIDDTIDETALRTRLARHLGRELSDPAPPAGGPIVHEADARSSAPFPESPGAPPRSAPASAAAQAADPAHPSETPPAQHRPGREIDPRDVLDPAAEIQRLARIMLADLKLYNPDRFASAMNDGRFLETFRNELLRGKDLITARFPDLPDRLALLTAALRRSIEEEQSAAGSGS